MAPEIGTSNVRTGGAAGIGRVIAERFVTAGTKVLICDVDREALGRTLTRQPALSDYLCGDGGL